MIELVIYIVLCIIFSWLYSLFLIRPFLEIVGHGKILNKEERKASRKLEKEYRAFKRQQRRKTQ